MIYLFKVVWIILTTRYVALKVFNGDDTNNVELQLLGRSLSLLVTKGLAPSTTSKYQRGGVDG